MENYYIFSSGKMKRKDNNISIITKNKGKKDLKIEVVNEIYLFGEMSTNSKCLNYLGQMGVPVHFFNYYGFYTGSFYPKKSKVSGNLLIKQVEHYINKEKRVKIAKEFIYSASDNIYRNLRYYKGRGKDVEEAMERIKSLQEELENVDEVDIIMGIEGNIRKIYYSTWNEIINQEIDFEKRVKRPPDNMINSLISFVNTLVYTSCLSEIYKTQLNPTISYLHSAGEKRFSLSLDIAEIFKPLVADRLIFSLLNKHMITEKDFEEGSNFYYLKDSARMKILQEYDETLERTIRHRNLKRNVSYKFLFRLECYKLIKHLINEKEYKGFRIWW